MISRKLRFGMIGGGRGAFIGAVHRIAARMDGQAELVAGAFSSDPERSRASAADLFVAPERAYGSYRSEEHTPELQSRLHLVCRLLLEKKKKAGAARAGHRSGGT